MLFFPKKRAPSQPHPDWPWTLSVGGELWPDFDNWEMIVSELRELYPDNDSFIILEQKDPNDKKKYWFIQSAIALKGPDQGSYTVGCGYPGEAGPALVERCYRNLDDVIEIFKRAFQRKPLDLSGYKSFF